MAIRYLHKGRAPRAADGGVGIGFDPTYGLEIRQIISGVDTIKSALNFGAAATPQATSVANTKFSALYTKSTATSGDSRSLYIKHLFSGAGGSGDALRAWGVVDNVAAAVGGTVTGAHISLSVTGASGSVSGAGAAARVTLGADAQTRTLNGNVCALQLDSDLATGNTVPAAGAFIRVTDSGAVRINKLFQLPAASNSTLVATHTTDAMSHSIKCTLADGTAIYLMATTTPTNRGGGS